MPFVEPTPAPSPEAPPAAAAAWNNQLIGFAVAGGLALLALIIGAIYLLRRRRPEEEVYDSILWEDPAAAAPAQPEPAPAFVAAAPVPPAPVADEADVPRTELPEGFDLARYGPHVQEAYRGPTADNPSLSLKTRLRRARFLDQRERGKSVETPKEAQRGNPFMLRPDSEPEAEEPALHI